MKIVLWHSCVRIRFIYLSSEPILVRHTFWTFLSSLMRSSTVQICENFTARDLHCGHLLLRKCIDPVNEFCVLFEYCANDLYEHESYFNYLTVLSQPLHEAEVFTLHQVCFWKFMALCAELTCINRSRDRPCFVMCPLIYNNLDWFSLGARLAYDASFSFEPNLDMSSISDIIAADEYMTMPGIVMRRFTFLPLMANLDI